MQLTDLLDSDKSPLYVVVMVEPQVPTETPPSTVPPVPIGTTPSNQLRVKFFLTGCVFPVFCVATVIIGGGHLSVDSPWQSGATSDYVAMLVEWPGNGPFLPLIGYSIVCLATYCFRPSLRDAIWLQIGLGGGVVLALQFLIFVLIVNGMFTFFFALFAAPILALIVFLAAQVFRRRFTIRHLMIATGFVAIVAAFFATTEVGREAFIPTLGFVWIGTLAATPTLNFVTYVRAFLQSTDWTQRFILRNPRVGTGGLVAWLMAFVASWRFAVAIMLIEYAKLPTTDPNCYVSSAAASGHKRLVRRERDGVNQQMQRLKFLEFAFATAMPRCHRRLRRVYNRIGPKLANVCRRNVWFADLTFLLLTPLEWLSELIRVTISIPAVSVRRIYRSSDTI